MFSLNSNNFFSTVKECESTCPIIYIELCMLSPDRGPCDAAIPMYFFDAAGSKQCEQFIYGGCQGNENKFSTHAECEQVCNL